MKHIHYTFILLLLMSCGSHVADNQSAEIKKSSTWSKDKGRVSMPDTVMATETSKHEVIYKDSFIVHDANHFKEVKLKLTNFSQKKYQELQQQINACASDTGAFFATKGLRYHQSCGEVCVSFLTDLKNGIRMVVPSNYDEGISGIIVSPECNKLGVYSAYDGTDYSNYYEQRSEFYTFQVREGKGIQVLLPDMVYFTKSFTIEEMFWANVNTVILKTYAGDRQQVNADKLNYRYYQATLPTN